MIAITRSACRTPSSMSFASSLASATEWIGTLRTSMASGMWPLSPRSAGRGSVGYDDGAGVALHGVPKVGEVGDDRTAAAGLDEPAHRVHLRPHGAAGEVALGGVRAHLRDAHRAEVRGLGGAEVQDRVGYVGGDHEHVRVHGP